MIGSPLATKTLFVVGPVPITEPVVVTWCLMAALTLGGWLATRSLGVAPSRSQTVVEVIVGAIEDQIRDTMRVDAYIPTNLISASRTIWPSAIARLFHEDHKPAVDVGSSVSRVGGKTQAPALREAADTLRLDYAQFLELEMFTRFGGVTDAQVKAKIARGARIRSVLSQPQYAPLRLADEVALVLALQRGLLDRLPLEQIGKFRSELPGWLDRSTAPIVDKIERTGQLDHAKRAELETSLSALVDRLAWPSTESKPRTE